MYSAESYVELSLYKKLHIPTYFGLQMSRAKKMVEMAISGMHFEESGQENNSFQELKGNEDYTIILTNSEPNKTTDNFQILQNIEMKIVDNQHDMDKDLDFELDDLITFDARVDKIVSSEEEVFEGISEDIDVNIHDIDMQQGSENPLGEEHLQIIPSENELPITDDENNNKLVPYSESDSGSDSSCTIYPQKSGKRKKRFQVVESTWFAQKNKKLREKGEPYSGRVKKDGKWSYDEPKQPRTIKARCKCPTKETSTMKCQLITEDQRIHLFNSFWQYTWGEKKVYINNQVTSVSTKRHRNRKKQNETRRGQSFQYFLRVEENNYRVCRLMFLNTLGIGRWTVHNWKNSFGTRAPSLLRKNQSTQKQPFSDSRECLLQFLQSLPVMESHYCRASSQKQNILAEWQSLHSLYEFYVEDWCKLKHQVVPLSIASFSKMFRDKKLALFRPKKDECEKCVTYKVGQVSFEEHNKHIKNKEEARAEKEKDKKQQEYVFTADLQAVLMSPKSKVSTLYYKTKLQVHNLCFYNLKNSEAFCFLWNESEGGVGAEEFASIWMFFIENMIVPNIPSEVDINKRKTLIIYSDGCGYQNRNCLLANVLLNVAALHNLNIEQKYLEPGHTQMEVDSIHATIEKKLRNTIINLPADYVEVCQKARKKPSPYKVKYLSHDFFRKFVGIDFYKSIRPGKTKGDHKVTDIRALKYTPEGEIFYKIEFSDEWTSIPQRKNTKIEKHDWYQLDQLYTERLKITAKKFADLQAIKKTLSVDYHKFYDDLPHE